MHVIFLDIDGVLNSMEYAKRSGRFKGSSRNAEFIDPDAVTRLNKIVEATGASIVVSSSWRYGYIHDLPGLIELFQRHNIKGDVLGITPILAGTRGKEIAQWLSEHDEVTRFIIIDDSSDMGNLSSKLVMTSTAYGLQDQHVEEAIDKLLAFQTSISDA